MSELTGTTPSSSGEGGTIVQIIPQLPEVVVEVTDLEGDYGGELERVRDEVEWTNRTGGPTFIYLMATARVHVMVSDQSVRRIGCMAFMRCSNLVKVTAPFVEEVRVGAFSEVYNLRHVTLGPNAVVKPKAFAWCLSLEVIAAAVGFELDTGNRVVLPGGNWNDPTVGITRFAKWRNQMDDNKEHYKVAMGMFELANSPSNGERRNVSNDRRSDMGLCSGTGARYGEARPLFCVWGEGREG